ncbi:hypothetical protein D3C79_215210 [compost metagenome]
MIDPTPCPLPAPYGAQYTTLLDTLLLGQERRQVVDALEQIQQLLQTLHREQILSAAYAVAFTRCNANLAADRLAELQALQRPPRPTLAGLFGLSA